MNRPATSTGWPSMPEPDHLHALHDDAMRQAHALRREAIQDFWRGADAAFATTLDTAQRSAVRLGQRLARHWQSRPHPTPEA